jgi:hypothetical protein
MSPPMTLITRDDSRSCQEAKKTNHFSMSACSRDACLLCGADLRRFPSGS